MLTHLQHCPTWILSLHTLALSLQKCAVLPPYFRPWQAGTCHSTTVTCDNNLCFDFCMYAATNRPSDSSICHLHPVHFFFLHITKFAELAVSELVNKMCVSLSSVEKTEHLNHL